MSPTALIVFTLLAQTAPLDADPEARGKAKALLVEGSAHYDAGDYAGALEKFTQAREAYASPKIWFNIGQANRDLGRYADAMAAFDKFLAGATDATAGTRAEAQKAIGEMKSKLGTLRIECAIPGAEVSVDGKSEGQAPLPEPIWVMPGRHQVTALAPGIPPIVEAVTVAAGAESVVGLTAQVAQPQRLRENPYGDIAEVRPARREPADHTWWLGRKWTWVAAGSTVVLASGAIIAGAMMQSKFDDLRSSCGRGNPAFPGCTQSDVDAVKLRRDTANVFWGLTAVAAAATGVLFYFEGRPVTVAPMAGAATGLLAEVRY